MFKIIVAKECGCFRKSDMQGTTTVDSKDEALTKGLEMVNIMNNDFCKKHSFTLEEQGDTFLI